MSSFWSLLDFTHLLASELLSHRIIYIFVVISLKKSFSLSEDAPTPAWLKGVAPEWKKVESWWHCSGDRRRRPTTQRLAPPCWLRCGKDIKVLFVGTKSQEIPKNTFWELPIRFASQNDRNGEGYPNILSNYFIFIFSSGVSLCLFILFYPHFLAWCYSTVVFSKLSAGGVKRDV